MSNMQKRSGEKYGGDHTTFIPAAATLADIAAKCVHVTRISPGTIECPRSKSGSRRHVKIIDADHWILLSVTDGAAHQEVKVYVSDAHEAKLCIARGARNQGITISFGKG